MNWLGFLIESGRDNSFENCKLELRRRIAGVIVLFIKIRFAFLICALALNLSCATPQFDRYSAIQKPDQSSYFNQGEQVIVSDSGVSVSFMIPQLLDTKAEHVTVLLRFANNKSAPVTILPDDLLLTAEGIGDVNILSLEEHDELIDRITRTQRIGLALQAGGAAMGSTTTSYHSGTVGGSVFSGTTTTNQPANPARQQEIERNISDLRSSIAARKAAYIRPHTIMPNEGYEATLVFTKPSSLPNPTDFILRVIVDSFPHEFRFRYEGLANQ